MADDTKALQLLIQTIYNASGVKLAEADLKKLVAMSQAAGAASVKAGAEAVDAFKKTGEALAIPNREALFLATSFGRLGASGEANVSSVIRQLLFMRQAMGAGGAAGAGMFSLVGGAALIAGYFLKRDAEIIQEIRKNWVEANRDIGSGIDHQAVVIDRMSRDAQKLKALLDSIHHEPTPFEAGEEAAAATRVQYKREAEAHNKSLIETARIQSEAGKVRSEMAQGLDPSTFVSPESVAGGQYASLADTAMQNTGKEMALSAYSSVFGQKMAAAAVAADKTADQLLKEIEAEAARRSAIDKAESQRLSALRASANVTAEGAAKERLYEDEARRLNLLRLSGKPDVAGESVLATARQRGILPGSPEYKEATAQAEGLEADAKTREAELKKQYAAEKKDSEAHFQSIAEDEKRSIKERIAALRELAKIRKEGLAKGEAELVDVETQKKIDEMTKHKGGALRGEGFLGPQADSLARIGLNVGASMPMAMDNSTKRTADALERIERDGVKIRNPHEPIARVS